MSSLQAIEEKMNQFQKLVGQKDAIQAGFQKSNPLDLSNLLIMQQTFHMVGFKPPALLSNTIGTWILGDKLSTMFAGKSLQDLASEYRKPDVIEQMRGNISTKLEAAKEKGINLDFMKDLVNNLLDKIGIAADETSQKPKAEIGQLFEELKEQVAAEKKEEAVKQATSNLSVKIGADGSMEVSGDPEQVKAFMEQQKKEVAGEHVGDNGQGTDQTHATKKLKTRTL